MSAKGQMVSSFIALVKFRYHITFLNVVFGALIFAQEIGGPLLIQLALLYLCFNVLLYGGIYTLNDLADREADGRHPTKRFRPIAAGDISPRAALVFGIVLVVLGLASGSMLFSRDVLACFIGVLLINAAYSTGGRNVPFLDLVLNSLPHPTRFLMGALLVDRVPPAGHLVALSLLAIALSCLRRHVEQDVDGWRSRATLGRYSPRRLEVCGFACLTLLAIVCLLSARLAPGFSAVVLTAGLVLIFGGHRHQLVRAPLRAVWVK